MSQIYLSSDYHFCHDREFIWKARGFSSVQEMNEAIVERHNALIKPEDSAYLLGDIVLGGAESRGIDFVKMLNGKITIIAGNHDTPARRQKYAELGFPVYDALAFSYRKYHFYLSHYPTLTANLEKESLKQCTLNLFGHTHQKDKFYNDMPFMYHVGVDSHDCRPVCLDTIIEDMKAKVEECKEQL